MKNNLCGANVYFQSNGHSFILCKKGFDKSGVIGENEIKVCRRNDNLFPLQKERTFPISFSILEYKFLYLVLCFSVKFYAVSSVFFF